MGSGAFIVLDSLFASQMTPARATELLGRTSPELVSVLKAEFPKDFNTLLNDVLVKEKAGADPVQVSEDVTKASAAIASAHRDVARRAPTELVADWLNKLSDAIMAVNKAAGPQICARFINEGQSVIADKKILAGLSGAFDKREAAFFKALAAARDATNAQPVAPATDADWTAIGTAMSGMEVPDGYAEIVAKDDKTSPNYCSALSYFFRSIEKFPGDTGKRIRAEYFVRSFS